MTTPCAARPPRSVSAFHRRPAEARRAARTAAVAALCAAVGLGGVLPPAAWAKPTEFPTTKPVGIPGLPPPATLPVGDPPQSKEDAGDKGGLESPAEIMRKLKAEKDRKAKQARVAFFDLSDPIGERAADFSLFGDTKLNLRTLTEGLAKIRTDNSVKGVLITLGNPGLSLSQAQEVRDALAAVVKAGKPVFVHADEYDTASYTLASGASDVCLLGGGELMLPGVGIEEMFLKGLFDKVGVKADYVQIGEYKGADEQYTRTGASEELKGELRRLVDGLHAEVVAGIAAARKVEPDVVKASIDESMVSGKLALSRKLVDHLVDQDGLRDLITKKLGGGEINLDPAYGAPKREAVDFSNPFGLLASLAKKSEPAADDAGKPAVAVVYAEGVIVDGEAGDELFGDGGNVGSENLRKAFRTALRDDDVKAVVIRIDSPGGSALASEVMWQAARRLAAKKPVVVSVGGMAASGGYYLASAADTIYADPTAIVGSIGVVGGKFVMKGLYDLAGVKTETFAAGRNAGLFSSNQPFSDRQRVQVTTWMKSTYDQFTERVMTTRKGKIGDIDRVARGRIFVARQAKELGMVDEIGGLQAAVAAAAKKGGLKDGAFEVKQVPAPKTLGDYLSGNAGNDPQASAAGRGGSPTAGLPTAAAAPRFKPAMDAKLLDGLLAPLGPAARRQAARQLRVMQLLQDRPVMLVSPFTVTVK